METTDDVTLPGRSRLVEIARAVTPPRFLRLYQERATFRRRVKRAMVWSFVPVLLWAFVFADGGLLSIVARRVHLWQLQRQVVRLEARQALLQQAIEHRESDPVVLERLARERYGMAQPGETVYRIVEITPDKGRAIAREQRKLAKAAAAAQAADGTSDVAEREARHRGDAPPPTPRRR